MTTEAAQRRLLEALAGMHKTASSPVLSDLAHGLRAMATIAPHDTLPGVAGMYLALADLSEAVRTDLNDKETSS